MKGNLKTEHFRKNKSIDFFKLFSDRMLFELVISFLQLCLSVQYVLAACLIK